MRLRRPAAVEVGQFAHKARDLRSLDRVGDHALRLVDEVGVVELVATARVGPQSCVEGGEARFTRRVDQHPVDLTERVVAGRAVGLPPRGQLLTVLEDLLDQNVGASGLSGEPLEVAARIDETVRVVDPQPVGEPFAHPAEHLGVALVEHPRDLDPDAGQRGDGEEAPVVQLPGLATPEDRLPMLLREDLLDHPRIFQVGAAETRHRNGDRVGGERQDVLVVEAHQAVRRELRRRRIDRDLSLGDHLVDAGPEDRHAHLAAAEVPVDVERLGVARIAAVGQDVPPPGVLHRLRDAHVVRDGVDQDAEPRCPRRDGEPVEPVRAAARRVDLRGIDHVVPVIGPLRRLQQRRQVRP